jgi:hypothetical protein
VPTFESLHRSRDMSYGVSHTWFVHNTFLLFPLQLSPGVSYKFLLANPEVPGSIPGATRFSEYQWVWNRVHSALVRINEEQREGKVAAPV